MTTQQVTEQLNAGVGLHRAGDVLGARRIYEDVLRAHPQDADALHLLGLVAHQTGDLAHACHCIEASIALRPGAPRVYFNLAVVRAQRGDLAGAMVAYEEAIAVKPDYAEAHSNLGNLYARCDRPDDALRAYRSAIDADPDFVAARCNLGKLLIDLARYDDAIETLSCAIRREPNTPDAHAHLGQAYRRRGRFREAIAASWRSLELRPNDRDAHLNVALALAELNELEAAIEVSELAFALDPVSAEVQCCRSLLFHKAGRYHAAISAAQAAIQARPDLAAAHVNLSLAHLILGDFARGWSEYTWMWRVPTRRALYPYLDRLPLWAGESFAGRQLVITRDQGFGDAIQMVRYLPAVKARGGRVALHTLPALAPLFAQLADVDELRVVDGGGQIEAADDLHIPLLGLPGALGTELASIPAPIPYLHAPPERITRWSARLARACPEPDAAVRVGIVWAGDTTHASDHHRSVAFEQLAPLARVPGIAWFGLQKCRDEERRSFGAVTLEPLGAEIVDFADTAAILEHLDLVISVDTAIVHLAGAMGKPVWTLIAFAPDWRWLLARDDSPWYPTMRIFRQPRAGDWEAVVAVVARELAAFVARARVQA
jgi:tetratricopeptide (TPR) repeat protein